MRREYHLLLVLGILQGNGVIPLPPEACPPPGVVIELGHGGVVNPGRRPVIALHGVNLHALDHNQQIRVHIQHPVRTGLRRILPVVRVGGIIPLGHDIRFIRRAVGFILQVDGKDGVIILIIVCKPLQSRTPVLRAELVRIPKVDLMPGGGSFCAVYINHDLDARLFAPLHCLVPDVKAVLNCTALHPFHSQLRIRIDVDLGRGRIRIPVFPL